MKRKIIEIDEEKCNGCGNCVTGCAEGALQIVDGKAKLVNEVFCDGLGACIGTCPTGALKIIERDAPEFDEEAVEEHLQSKKTPPAGGCPGLQLRFNEKPKAEKRSVSSPAVSGQVIPSELNQWPTQLHLVPPNAPFFKNRELVVLSTCSPSASPDVNWRFIRGRAIAIACPKLDRTEGYVEKLTEILKSNGIPKVIVVRMEVPCCGGLTALVQQAVRRSGRTDLVVEEATIGLNGDLIDTKEI
ncbi:ATP-binding protein [Tichowtungia aerotolerans]|uniref:4Fe-4S dicluster domain-containing protein n=1 Tax=Tichowtungia aerotolerans TaxID=2697043 RepID=A0A6P1MB71_9BACT|nr:4Fe-4S binding protein [Tichowtungia aerotolerans]QHI69348.1 4Fe-4S dicluster domain-containing protein [Tichowtungia aerotolerans]